MAQPLLGIVDLAIGKLLNEFGIIPDMLAGHSYGELPALAFANVFDEAQLLPLSCNRAEAILSSIADDHGAMVAIQADKARIDQLLSNRDDLYAVNHNAPNQHVVAGKTIAIAHLISTLKENNISFRKLAVACAFHSPLIKRAEPIYYEKLSAIPFNKPNIPVWSNTTASPYPEEEEAIKSRLAKHLVSPVRFTEQIAEMYTQGARIFIEVGPGKSLTGLTKSILGKDEVLLYTEEKGKGGITQLLMMLAQFMATGRSIKLNTLFAGRDVKALDLDRPEQFKKSPSIWLVDGQRAIPLHGKLPTYSALPVIKPIIDFKNLSAQISQQNNSMPITDSAERLTLEYLASMKTLIQAQRDVLLAYLGQNVPTNTPALPSIPADVKVPIQLPEPIVSIIQATPSAITTTQKDLSSILLEVVSEKTGYPIEMLGMELDLEADLSIDSIKRMEIIGELRLRLANFKFKGEHEEDIVEQLATIKTLNGLLNWFGTHLKFTSTSKQTGSIEPERLSETALQEVILETVSEKTGYPKEMLGLDLDIEADLSIDSIKRIEIIGTLKGKLAHQLPAIDLDAENIEKGTAFKTLRDLIDWITTNMQTHPKTVEISAQSTGHAMEPSNLRLKRIKFELASAKISTATAGDLANINGKRIAITRDGKLGDLIKVALEKNGAIASLVTQDDPLVDYDGLIILDMNASKHRLNIIEAVNMVKALDMNRVKWIYVLSDHHAAHLLQHNDPKFLRTYQGYTGFIKSLDKEYEHAKCRTLHFMRAIDENKIPNLLVNELQCMDEPALIYYNENGRHAVKEMHEPLSIENKKPFVLDRKAVVLVLGGAQGITAALTTHLAKDFPCHYILVGRSAYPEVGHLPGMVQTKEQIRQYLIEQEYAQNPAAIEQQTTKLYKGKQIIATMEAIESQGSQVSYYTVDVRDEGKFTKLLQTIYAEYGRIDGVIHGAGILEDKLFQNKTSDSFERVFSTKVTPLRVLAEHLDNDTQFIIFFSSIASVYGNRGQTDYAAANSVLDHYAEVLGEKMKGRVMAINWGPWKGAGMVSPALEKEYERRGISLIPLESGKETFTNEIKYGNEGRVLIMA